MKSSILAISAAVAAFALAISLSVSHLLAAQTAHSRQYETSLGVAASLSRDQSLYEQATTLMEDERQPFLALNGFSNLDALKNKIYIDQDAFARGEQLTLTLERELAHACYLLALVAAIAPVLLSAYLILRRKRSADGDAEVTAVRTEPGVARNPAQHTIV